MPPDRRKPNAPATDAVDDTVELLPKLSRRQAALVMTRDGVPMKVIRRVIDEPEQRRRKKRDG